MKTSALFLITVLAFSNISYSQNDSVHKPVSGKHGNLYLKCGIDLFMYSTEKIEISPAGHLDFWGSAAYDVNKRVQVELLYRYIGDLIHDYLYINYRDANPEYYYFENFDEYHSHDFCMKTNFFLNENKKQNPFYLTGSFIYSLQAITNKDSLWKSYDDTAIHYTKNNYSYNRVMLGFSLGVGLYLDMGRFGFQNEIFFAARFAPFTDKGYKEFFLGMSFAPVFKF